MFNYMKNDSISITIRNRSYRAVCPDCGSMNTFIADGEIVLYDTTYDMDRSYRSPLCLSDIDANIQINMLCKTCRNKNGNKDNCIIENFEIYRLFSAFDRFCICNAGISTNKWCELSKQPEIIDGKAINTYIMPSVRYILPKLKKDMIDSMLSSVMADDSMTEGIYKPLYFNIQEDDTAYYGVDFSLDESVVVKIYDFEKDGDYETFVNHLFIRKIDQLARLIELATP